MHCHNVRAVVFPLRYSSANSMSIQQKSESDKLKAEGNALFAKNDFPEAYKKYTEALRHDDKNAILYCNRAACSLGLNR